MTSEPALPASPARLKTASSALIGAAIVLVVLGQTYLIFTKSINWDEFLHLSQIHDLRGGRLVQAFQMLHTRIFYWVPLVATDVIRQVQVVRLGMLGFELVTIAAIFGLARRFVPVEAALLSCLAYVGGGQVFQHGFALRPDPIATAMLMSALWLAATQRLKLPVVLAIGALIGLGGAATIKDALYLPCFAGIAWWRYSEATDRRQVLRAVATVGVVASLVFAVAILLHAQSLPSQAPSVDPQPLRTILPKFFAEGLFPRGHYTVRQIVMAPLLAAVIALAPLAWRRCGLTGPARVALLGLMLPLLSLVVYRNTFPYYFVFLLAPVVVAAAPALQLAMRRFDWRFVVAMLLASPLILLAKEPREYLGKQRALIDQVNRMYPPGTPYLSYSGMISDNPRIVPILISGVGIASYHRNGEAIVAREIRRGRVPFIIADHRNIQLALEGRPVTETLLPADVAAMRGNYVRFWGPLWLEGKQLPEGSTAGTIEIERGGPFTLAGSAATIDGNAVRVGEVVELEPGRHMMASTSKVAPILWRGTEVPKPPDKELSGAIYTDF